MFAHVLLFTEGKRWSTSTKAIDGFNENPKNGSV